MEELIEILESVNNVLSISFDNINKMWTITYKNGLHPDTMSSDLIIEFLQNA